jgi:hypothetical protein
MLVSRNYHFGYPTRHQYAPDHLHVGTSSLFLSTHLLRVPGRGRSAPLGKPETRDWPFFRRLLAHLSFLCLRHPRISSHLRSCYRFGTGSASTRPTMAPNSRRVRSLFAREQPVLAGMFD